MSLVLTQAVVLMNIIFTGSSQRHLGTRWGGVERGKSRPERPRCVDRKYFGQDRCVTDPFLTKAQFFFFLPFLYSLCRKKFYSTSSGMTCSGSVVLIKIIFFRTDRAAETEDR